MTFTSVLSLKIMKSKSKGGPDSGWSWVVALAACFTTTIIAGIYRIYGLLLLAFIHEFNVPRETASWPLVLYIAVFKLSGIVAGPLAFLYGVRSVSILGSIVGSVGVAICCCVSSLEAITFFFGVIFGFGTGVVYTLIPIIINQYFLKHRATAMGIALSGAGIGTLIFPIVHEYLIANYGLKGYFLLIGGIVLQTVVTGALLRPPPWLKKSKDITKENLKEYKSLKGSKLSMKGVKSLFRTSNYTISSGQYTENQESYKPVYLNSISIIGNSAGNDIICSGTGTVNEVVNIKCNAELYYNTEESLPGDSKGMAEEAYVSPEREREVSEDFHDLKSGRQTFSSFPENQSKCYENLVPEDFKKKAETALSVNKSFHISEPEDHCHVNFKKGNIGVLFRRNLNDNTKNETIRITEVYSNINSSDEYDKMAKTETFDEKKKIPASFFHEINYSEENTDNLRTKNHGTDAIKTVTLIEMKASLSIARSLKTILKSPMFHITSVSNAGCFSILLVYPIIIVDFATDRGVSEVDTKYILFAFAIADLIGSLGFGWITDKKYIHRSHYVMICMMVTALIFFIYPLVYGFTMHVCFSSIYGMLSGCTVVVYPILLDEYLGKEMQDIGIGFMEFFNGIVLLIWPSIIGYFRDNLGSYSIMFFILGAIAFSASILWLFEKCQNKSQEAPASNHSAENHN